MKATSGDLPYDDDGWAYEVKWDGMRLVAQVDGPTGTLELRTTNDLDATPRFPELARLPEGVGPHRVVIDGEVVALDADGRPSFGLLQSRMHVARDGTEVPVSFVAFDLLHLDGSDTTDLPYRDRRQLLESVVEPGSNWQVAPAHEDGAALLDAARAQGLEGIMAKRVESRYEPGKRSRSWIKIKVRRQQELVVGGWLPGTGGREGTLGSLLVGYYEQGALRFAGRVGTGFKAAELARLERLLTEHPLPTSPFDPAPPRSVIRAGARYCRPDLVVEVAFAEWTSEGRLRHPSYLGQRADKDPRDVVREPS